MITLSGNSDWIHRIADATEESLRNPARSCSTTCKEVPLKQFRCIIALALVVGLGPQAFCQQVPTSSSPTAQQPQAPGTDTPSSDHSVSLKSIVPHIIEDQRRIYWDFPSQLGRGKHWLPAVTVLAATAGLLVADQYEAPYFRRTSTFHGFNSGFSGTNTSLGILLAPLSMYGIGLLTKNGYAENTALLSGEAVADSEIFEEALKLATRRARPSSIPPYGDFSSTFFSSNTITDGGFPSGHTIAAFSVATIMAERYGKRHRWVPYVAYGLAGTVGFSRMTISAHFPADVFVGAALGYTISRFAVLRAEHHP